MIEDHREILSTGMDGELSSEALRFLLRRLDHDRSLRETWSRYHVIGQSMRNELPTIANAGFAERMMRVIMSETGGLKTGGLETGAFETNKLEMARQETGACEISARETNTRHMQGAKPRHWMRWSAGGAIAAGVAVVALMAARPVGDSTDHVAPRFALNDAKVIMTPSAPTLQAKKNSNPAAAPAWLRDNSQVSLLSERASATLDSNGIVSPYASSLRSYQVSSRYRTLTNRDGSYLLLIDAEPTPATQQGEAGVRAAVH